MKTTAKYIAVVCVLALATALAAKDIHLNPSEEPFFKKFRHKVIDDLKKAFVHAPFKRAKCVDCHSSMDDASQLKSDLSVLCLECHQDQVLQKEKNTVHDPFEDCGECHNAHASEERYLLKDAPNNICTECHEADDDDLKAKHKGFIPQYAKCIECHNVHASDRDGLIHEGTLHDPFEDCEDCHAEAGEDGKVQLTDNAGGLVICGECHDDITEEVASAEHRHSPARWGGCYECHSPHVARSEPMLKEKTVAEICLRCHSSTVNPQSHPVASHKTSIKGKKTKLGGDRDFDCVSCHDPHGSKHPKLRRAPEKDFCVACHEGK